MPPPRRASPAFVFAQKLARLMDEAIPIPGTRYRIGLDPILGLIPGVGDVAGGAVSTYLILLASNAGAPISVLARMAFNVMLDTVIGAIPLLGDLFDAGWKANKRNLALLEQYLAHPREIKRSSRGFVAVVIVIFSAAVAGAIWIALSLLGALVELIKS